ncbi:5-methyltetrahydropteroyltriglutamate--homocysteine S-methyltransferase [uncultured Algimonas sp.]|uniref:5-methyltetrahydropteroyltriglutamate-- homocysteine S-methyltransferase n=1 Tax=uncultured Algimonas sp. TaxID=1547920 RepID=UPI002621E13B|nr:5-methyltetrahydropteroyltriglutamate--homocysteine S-methyltransferase [uncultured Algimonas sp.]
MTVTTASLGFPRIGPKRGLKFALERYWSGQSGRDALLRTAQTLRASAWERQKNSGIDHVPSGDFSLYDHVLDMTVMLGAIPSRYGKPDGGPDGDTALDRYFTMARGARGDDPEGGCTHRGGGQAAMEMTKWFDTNYHYIVPEVTAGTRLRRSSDQIVQDYREAKALGIETRPVLVGPVTWLSLAKGHDVDPLGLLGDALDVYAELLVDLAAAGADWVQIDEPCLVTDLNPVQTAAYRTAYAALAKAGPKIMLTSYFGKLGDNLDLVADLPVAGLHIDLVRAPEQLEPVLAAVRPDLLLSLGVIDGRNVWRADLAALLDRLAPVAAERDLVLAPSCSLLHVPIDLDLEPAIDPELTQWLAFAVQKLGELDSLKRALNAGRDSVADDISAASDAARSRRRSTRIHDPAVARRTAGVTPNMSERPDFATRRPLQAERLGLPSYPTTTIGSFPQTKAVRQARAAHRRGTVSDADYTAFLQAETKDTILWQEAVGLDMLVHGEFERNDMVQYFGERLSGFAFTQNGWVQSYGSRCVRPPILYGDVSRPAPMTVDWWAYAQSLTERPVKGMLTGPVTILNWSFVRDDQPRSQTCQQIALAIREEVTDLEAAGARAIQIDEAALREGLPLRMSDWESYLDWAIAGFRLAAAGVQAQTQIHTHMCYSEFNDILPSIAAMDADVLSIETARSQMELLQAFADYQYPSGIGPGVYDIHSPRVPDVEEMVELLRLAGAHIAPDQLWVNPDCGLKTRSWDDVGPALSAMVEAARRLRVPA